MQAFATAHATEATGSLRRLEMAVGPSLVAILVCFWAVAAPIAAETSLEVGRELVRVGECNKALGHLLGAYQREEPRVEALVLYGYCLRETDQHKRARLLAREILAGQPEPEMAAAARNLLGTLELDAGDPKRAIGEFEEAWRLAPENAYRFNLAVACSRSGDSDRAESEMLWVAEKEVAPSRIRAADVTIEEWDQLTERWLELDPDEPILDLGSVEPPVKIEVNPPEYTTKARRKNIQGRVIIRGTIDRQGRVHDLVAIEGLPHGLTDAALKAVSKWRFQPARFRGEAVNYSYYLSVNFRLR